MRSLHSDGVPDGTTGSMISAYVFGKYNGHSAFYLALAPIGIVLATLYFFKRAIERTPAERFDTSAIIGSQH
ncbi:MAG TPA: hypothetical protein VGP06_17755 [Janthinobacterium sp.]|nr:hypothetical protein [Janthinobacterium sp.]